MTELQAGLAFGIGLLAALVFGVAAGWGRDATWGVAVGCLLVGAGGVVAAGGLAWERAVFLAHAVTVPGRLLSHESDGPQVEYVARDGEPRQVKGLGGSQSGVEPGGMVPVRLLPEDPARAIVSDFQNLWGGVFAFAVFGLLPGAFGAFFLAVALQDRRGRAPRRPSSNARLLSREAPVASGMSPSRRGWGRTLAGAGHAMVVVAVASGIWAHDGMAELGRVFVLAGLGFAFYGVAAKVTRQGGWELPGTCAIMALGFVLFGGGAMLLGQA